MNTTSEIFAGLTHSGNLAILHPSGYRGIAIDPGCYPGPYSFRHGPEITFPATVAAAPLSACNHPLRVVAESHLAEFIAAAEAEALKLAQAQAETVNRAIAEADARRELESRFRLHHCSVTGFVRDYLNCVASDASLAGEVISTPLITPTAVSTIASLKWISENRRLIHRLANKADNIRAAKSKAKERDHARHLRESAKKQRAAERHLSGLIRTCKKSRTLENWQSAWKAATTFARANDLALTAERASAAGFERGYLEPKFRKFTTLLNLTSDDAKKAGFSTCMRGDNATLTPCAEPSRIESKPGQSRKVRGKWRTVSKAVNDNFVRSIVSVSGRSAVVTIHETEIRLRLPAGYHWRTTAAIGVSHQIAIACEAGFETLPVSEILRPNAIENALARLHAKVLGVSIP